MKILMLGWEYPPFQWGGLAVVCEGLTKALARLRNEVLFAIPYYPTIRGPYCSFLPVFGQKTPDRNIDWWKSTVSTYSRPTGHMRSALWHLNGEHGGSRMLQEEVLRFASLLGSMVGDIPHDVIHAHDWLTYPAALTVQSVSGKPIVAHVHTIEVDRTGGNGRNAFVYQVEHEMFSRANALVAVSELTKERIIQEYAVAPERVTVVHNGFDWERYDFSERANIFPGKKVVLFLGRMTLQRGPDYFFAAAEIVARHCEDAIFVMAGEGDMRETLICRAAASPYHDRFFFTRAWGKDTDRLFERADVFVMPTVSDPFGMVLLEAVAHRTPVVCSKTCGAVEVIPWAMKVDFWDRDELANKIIALLRYPALRWEEMRLTHASLPRDQWRGAAERCRGVYEKVTARNL